MKRLALQLMQPAAMTAFGFGIIIGIASMIADGAMTRLHVDTPPPLHCQCSCDGDSAVLEITTPEGD